MLCLVLEQLTEFYCKLVWFWEEDVRVCIDSGLQTGVNARCPLIGILRPQVWMGCLFYALWKVMRDIKRRFYAYTKHSKHFNA
jgi:hypothetical protein